MEKWTIRYGNGEVLGTYTERSQVDSVLDASLAGWRERVKDQTDENNFTVSLDNGRWQDELVVTGPKPKKEPVPTSEA